MIFSLDGLGLMSFEAAINRDYPVVFGTLFIFTLVGLVVKLIGLGVDELSVSARSIPEVKARVREFSLSEAQGLAQQALAVGSPAEVRALVEAV